MFEDGGVVIHLMHTIYGMPMPATFRPGASTRLQKIKSATLALDLVKRAGIKTPVTPTSIFSFILFYLYFCFVLFHFYFYFYFNFTLNRCKFTKKTIVYSFTHLPFLSFLFVYMI